MFPELNTLLSASTDCPERPLFTLISGCGTDASFLVHHFLSYYLKASCKLCFVSLAQSFSHYNVIAQKLGVSLVSARDRGQLVFLEGLRCYNRLLFPESAEPDAENPLRFLRTGSDLRPLYDFICAALAPSAGEPWKCPVLIVDDVGLLLSLGVGVGQVLDFIHYCRASVCREQQGNVVCLIQRDGESEDAESELLMRSLCHQSALILQAGGLSSGYCKDVHGELTITRKPEGQPATYQYKPEGQPATYQYKPQGQPATYQYKIQDKTVTFFARGLSAAVL